jgi:hypothetical protein
MEDPMRVTLLLLVLGAAAGAQPVATFAGMTCTQLSESQVAEVERFHGEACGVFVKDVAAGSMAAVTGVQPGDILLAVREPGEDDFYGIPVPLDSMIQYGEETTPSTEMRLLFLRREGTTFQKLVGYLGKPMAESAEPSGSEDAAPGCNATFEPEPPTTVLAKMPDGTPLTQQDVDLYGGVMAWAFGTRLTEAQRATIRDTLVEFWPQAPPTFNRDFDLGFRKLPERLPQMPPEARQQLQLGYAQTFMLLPRQMPEHPISRVVLEVSAAARQVLAGAGTAHELTQQDVDSLLEYLCFQTQMQTGQPVVITPPQHQAFTQQVVAHFQATPASRPQLAAMDVVWARLRARWTAAALAQRQALLQQWQQAYTRQSGPAPYMTTWQNAYGNGGEMSDSTFDAVMNAMNATHNASMHTLGGVDGTYEGSWYDGAGNWLYDQ